MEGLRDPRLVRPLRVGDDGADDEEVALLRQHLVLERPRDLALLLAEPVVLHRRDALERRAVWGGGVADVSGEQPPDFIGVVGGPGVTVRRKPVSDGVLVDHRGLLAEPAPTGGAGVFVYRRPARATKSRNLRP